MMGNMEQAPRGPFERIIFVCCNEREPGEDACANRGSVEIQKRLKEYVKDHGLKERLRVSRAMCLGLCSIGPNVCVMPDNAWYHHVSVDDLPKLIAAYVTPLEQKS